MKLSTLCGSYWEYWLQAVWNNVTCITFKLCILLFASCQMSKLAETVMNVKHIIASLWTRKDLYIHPCTPWFWGEPRRVQRSRSIHHLLSQCRSNEEGAGPMDVLLSIHATAHPEVQYKGSVYHSSRGRGTTSARQGCSSITLLLAQIYSMWTFCLLWISPSGKVHYVKYLEYEHVKVRFQIFYVHGRTRDVDVFS